MKKTVLILNGGNTAGILISRCINMSVLYRAISASSYMEHSRFVFDDYYPTLPFVQDKNFVVELNKLIEEKQIKFIIPTHDTIALALMENASEINAVIVCSELNTARICRYKSKTYAALAGCDFMPYWCFARELEVDKITSYPLLLKPDDAQGGKGVMKIENKEALVNAKTFYGDSVVCEYLPGDEYTVDCFTKSTGELIYYNPRKRAKITEGMSSLSESVKNTQEFDSIVNEVNNRIRFRGYWFVQLKRDKNGKLKLMELATRFAGTFAHAFAGGVNLPLLALSDFSGKDVSVVMNDYEVTTGKAFVDRYDLSIVYERVYIDYDDIVTCDHGDKLNSLIIAWLYQCKNQGKEIVMISRHTATKPNELNEDMHRLRIAKELFDKIYDIGADENKTDFMDNSKKSIFMDNSFEERMKVAKELGIPVFDVCHVDCLYDWKKL